MELELDPPVPYLRLANRAATGARRSRHSLVVDRRAGVDAMEVSVSGSTPAGREEKVYFRSDHFVFKHQYEVRRDASGFFDQEIIAIEEVADDFAKSVVTSILEGF